MKVIIAAAGTAGHINPGISIANKIKEEEPDSEIIFIGTKRGLENDLVPRAGYELKTIDAYGLNLKRPDRLLKTLKGFGTAKRIIREFKPDVVIGTGGYICGAAITMANKQKIPTLLHESNAFPGKAVKMLSKKTDCILVGFEDAKKRLDKAKKVVVTGNPTKIKDLNLSKDEKEKIIKDLGLDANKPILLVFGGSQGAKAINDSIIKIVKESKNKEYQIIWAPGPVQYNIIKEELEKNNIDIDDIENTKVYPYIYNMEEMMNISDLFICRAGAMTINEVSIVGKPAIFIPLPGVSQNHQEYNARVLESMGAAKIILNKDLESIDLNKYVEENKKQDKNIFKNVEDIIYNKDLLKQMGKKAKQVSNIDALEIIYKEIQETIIS